MADQRSRGDKKQGENHPQAPEERQGVRQEAGKRDEARPAAGQRGGPKPDEGQSRPQR